MLEELSISNIALIERASLHFSPGFNVLTGETGAGKSILAGALGLMRGDKGDVDLIRTGMDEAVVSAVFRIPPRPDLAEWLKEHGVDVEDGRITVRRVLRRQGKSSIYMQGQVVSQKELAEAAGMILDMHGQHEHQNLFDIEQHRVLLDRFGGLEAKALEHYSRFSEFAQLSKQREKLIENSKDARERQRLLEHGIGEIDEAKLRAGEDEELEQERRLIGAKERMVVLIGGAHQALASPEGAAISLLHKAKQSLHDAAALDTGLQALAERAESLYYELEDIKEEVISYESEMNFDPARLEHIEARLNVIFKLKKKYGESAEEILSWRDSAEQELRDLENFDETLSSLTDSLKKLETEVLQKAAELSRERKSAAARLKVAVEQRLKYLGMGKTVFDVALRQKESDRGSPICGPWGMDTIEFNLSANPGEPLKPLKNIASGGEISRIMLAIKSALADSDQVSCLVFDEVDSGIGGEVAVALGEHLHSLSRTKQILAITHLATIAVRADNHTRLEKAELDGRTFTRVATVSGDARVEEIARMLAGDTQGAASLGHAREILRRYHESGKF